MTQINPFAGSIVQSPQVQRSQADEKDQQARKNQDRSKHAGLGGGDTFEHQVESTEAPQPIHDEDERQNNPQQQQHRRSPQQPTEPPENLDDQAPPPHLDLTA
jgi:hypothetical protein